jgi:GT2 family glycosyltransferase
MNYIIATNTYRRPIELVVRSLRASLNQKLAPAKVILIDQNEQPVPLPPDINNHILFERQHANTTAVSKARNSLIIPHYVEWIFFCDDDGYPAENYSEILNEIIEKNPETEIYAGSIIRDDDKSYYTLRQKSKGKLNVFKNTKMLMGSNFVIKTNVFEELGRFDENFGVGSYWGSSEETDLAWKAFFAGKNMEFFPELIVYHIPPFNESLQKGLKKSYFYGIGKGALVYKWMFKKKKLKAGYELIEMTVVPFFQMARGIITLKWQLIPTNIAALAGRYYGLIKAAFVKK